MKPLRTPLLAAGLVLCAAHAGAHTTIQTAANEGTVTYNHIVIGHGCTLADGTHRTDPVFKTAQQKLAKDIADALRAIIKANVIGLTSKRAREQREAEEVLRRSGLPEGVDRPAAHGGGPMVLLNPGAQYGAAKCWLPENFALPTDSPMLP